MYSGPRYARHYRDLADAYDVEVRTSTTVNQWVESGLGLTFTSPAGIGEIAAAAVLLATGVRERSRAARLIPGPRIDSGFQSSVKGVFAAGNVLRGVETADRCALEGKFAAGSIASFLRSS